MPSLALAINICSRLSLFSRQLQPVQCPLYLPSAGLFEFPHLIHPISRQSPDANLGNTYTPSISPSDVATMFNFDIHPAVAANHCQLFFSFPLPSQLRTSSFAFSGPGTFTFDRYVFNTGAKDTTTWNDQPQLLPNGNSGNGIGSITLTDVVPGTSYMIWNGRCGDVRYEGGQKVTVQGGVASWRMSSEDTCLWYFQDWNECAIGLWMVYGSDEEEA